MGLEATEIHGWVSEASYLGGDLEGLDDGSCLPASLGGGDIGIACHIISRQEPMALKDHKLREFYGFIN